jgi:hypothetical protein
MPIRRARFTERRWADGLMRKTSTHRAASGKAAHARSVDADPARYGHGELSGRGGTDGCRRGSAFGNLGRLCVGRADDPAPRGRPASAAGGASGLMPNRANADSRCCAAPGAQYNSEDRGQRAKVAELADAPDLGTDLLHLCVFLHGNASSRTSLKNPVKSIK